MSPRFVLDVISQDFIASVYSPQYFDGNCSKFHYRCLEFIIQFCLEPHARSFSFVLTPSDYIIISNKVQ